MEKPFLFLCKLAWAARYRIPAIITVAFMAFDIRMQIEINIQMRTIRRRPHGDAVGGDEDDDGSSDDSWTTIDTDSESEDEQALIAVR